MKIMVTGGAGFIGKATIRQILTETVHDVINIDKLTYAGNLSGIAEYVNDARYVFREVDICDEDALASVFQQYQPTVVMHLAAESHVDRSINQPEVFIKTNIFGTYALLEVARRYYNKLTPEEQIRFRFHYVSSDEVYGDRKSSVDTASNLNHYAPSSPYSASKASADHLVRAWGRTYGLPFIISNSSNNFGPYQFPEKLIPQTIINAVQGKNIPIYGSGAQSRNWLYVEDHARALLKIATEGALGDTYHIGGYDEKRNIDVAIGICELLEEFMTERPSGIFRYRDLITFVEDRPGHDYRYGINDIKIRDELEWKPIETFESGLRKTVDWYIKNMSWWARLVA